MTGQFVIEVVCQWPIMGRYVKVSIPVGKILTLCEVEVMGVRVEGKWIFRHVEGILKTAEILVWCLYPLKVTFPLSFIIHSYKSRNKMMLKNV